LLVTDALFKPRIGVLKVIEDFTYRAALCIDDFLVLSEFA